MTPLKWSKTERSSLRLVKNKDMARIPFSHINWEDISVTEHPGTSGVAYWRTLIIEGIRLRMVEYSEGYLADHWCQKGHIKRDELYCI